MYKSRPTRIAIYFIEEKFKKLYPQQRYHYLIHNIPDSFFQEYLSESVWFELAPDGEPETLRYPDEERIKKITPAIMKILTRVKFFSALDDIMALQDKEKKGASCHGDFDLSKKILKTHKSGQKWKKSGKSQKRGQAKNRKKSLNWGTSKGQAKSYSRGIE